MSKFTGLKLLKEDSGPRADQPESVNQPQPSLRSSRPIGKRQNPEYQQISAYVRRTLYDEIRKQLIGTNEDFSDLLEKWMADWLQATIKR